MRLKNIPHESTNLGLHRLIVVQVAESNHETTARHGTFNILPVVETITVCVESVEYLIQSISIRFFRTGCFGYGFF